MTVPPPENPWSPPEPGRQPPGPAVGQSGPVWPQPTPWAPDGEHRETNAWAVVALVTGIVALIPIAIAAGIVALVQVGRRREAGKGLAIGGLVCAGVWTVIAVTLVAALAFSDVSSGGDRLGSVAAAGPDVAVGSCLRQPGEGEETGPPVSCDGPHDAEVFAIRTAPSTSWPGTEELSTSADDGCYDAFPAYVDRPYDDSDLDYSWFTPSRNEWAEGERRTVCAIVSDSPTTGSVRGSRR